MVNKAPYHPTRKYDPYLDLCIDACRKRVLDLNDDVLLVIVGDTGSGKSHLGMHIYNGLSGRHANVETIAFDKKTLAKSFSFLLNDKFPKGVPKVLINDEANVSKRNAMTVDNKEILDLYFTIRGKNIVSLWCNPSLEMLDKAFITERITGVFYVCTKSIDVPRRYIYFNRDHVLRILEKYGNLKLDTLRKHYKKNCKYVGYFRAYSGHMLEEYSKKKMGRMDDKLSTFIEKHADDDRMSRTEIENVLEICRATFLKIEKKLILDNILKEGHNMFRQKNGTIKFDTTVVSLFEKQLELNQERKRATQIKPKGEEKNEK